MIPTKTCESFDPFTLRKNDYKCQNIGVVLFTLDKVFVNFNHDDDILFYFYKGLNSMMITWAYAFQIIFRQTFWAAYISDFLPNMYTALYPPLDKRLCQYIADIYLLISKQKILFHSYLISHCGR